MPSKRSPTQHLRGVLAKDATPSGHQIQGVLGLKKGLGWWLTIEALMMVVFCMISTTA